MQHRRPMAIPQRSYRYRPMHNPITDAIAFMGWCLLAALILALPLFLIGTSVLWGIGVLIQTLHALSMVMGQGGL